MDVRTDGWLAAGKAESRREGAGEGAPGSFSTRGRWGRGGVRGVGRREHAMPKSGAETNENERATEPDDVASRGTEATLAQDRFVLASLVPPVHCPSHIFPYHFHAALSGPIILSQTLHI